MHLPRLIICLMIYALGCSSFIVSVNSITPKENLPEITDTRRNRRQSSNFTGEPSEFTNESHSRSPSDSTGTTIIRDFSGMSTTLTPTNLEDCRIPESRCKSVKSLDEIYSALHSMVKSHSGLARLSVIGTTYERNPIYAVDIQRGNAFHYAVIVVDFGLHPREWVGPAAALYLMEKLFEEGGKIIQNIQWFIIPVANPDGYVYATTVNNLWKKNRRPIEGKGCIGVDLNRNFGVDWEAKLSVDPCRTDYSGSEPFSEIESTSIRNLIETIGFSYVDAYVSVHACLQAIYYPSKLTGKDPPDVMANVLKEVGEKMAKAMYGIRNRSYIVEQKYLEGGGAIAEFMFNHFHIPLVYKMELGEMSYLENRNYHECYHPEKPAMAILIEECHMGLRSLALHLIEKFSPYGNKSEDEGPAGRREVNTTAQSGICRHQQLTFEVVTLIALQGNRLLV